MRLRRSLDLFASEFFSAQQRECVLFVADEYVAKFRITNISPIEMTTDTAMAMVD